MLAKGYVAGMAACAALVASGCGSAAAQVRTLRGTTAVTTSTAKTSSHGAGVFPTLTELSGLNNYTYAEAISSGSTSIQLVGKVDSTTNFEYKSNLASFYTVVLDGRVYTVAGSRVVSDRASSINIPPLSGFANQVEALVLNTVSDTVAKQGSCSQAGQSGESWQIDARDAQGTAAGQYFVCVQSAQGYLLSLVANGIAANGAAAMHETFRITSVGGVPYLPPPVA